MQMSHGLDKFSPIEKFNQIDNYWDPKVAAEFNGQQLRLAKLKGEFVWHSHANEDELFWVLEGNLTIEIRDENRDERAIHLMPGEILVIPKGTEHRPVANEEVKVALIEPASTVNTGETESELTKTNIEKI